MTAGAAVDDKRADERRIKELRDFQRSSPTNKRCFDCNEMMPQYVCVDFNTFVCTSCSGIHREFGHRVKSISMSKFTDTEVKNMLKFGGNEAAQKIWRAKHDASFRPSGGTDGERTRNFIRLTYIDKKWQYESPRASVSEEPQQRTGSGSTKKTSSSSNDFFSSGSSSKAAPSFDVFNEPSPQNNNGGFAAFGDFSGFDQPKKQQNDFDDFGRFDSPKLSASSQSTGGFGDFGNFSSKPAAAPPLRDEFKSGSFTLAPPPGSDFGAFAAPPPVPASTPVQTKAASGGNDFLAFSPVNSKPPVNDPFGFADSPVAVPKTNSQTAATPFDAFGSSPVGSSATNRSSFDAFGAPASTGRRSASSSFDAFGASVQPAAPLSPGFGAFGGAPTASFDAFGTPSTAATTTASSSAFGAFGSSQTPSSSAGFDAFGSSQSPAASGFDAFGAPASASSRTNSGAFGTPGVAPSDPFSGNSPRTSSGSKAAPGHPKPAPADPFSAFDSVEAAGQASTPAPAATGPAESAYGAFGSASQAPQQQVNQAPSQFGQPAQGFGQSHADPFAFAAGGSATETGSFSNSGLGAATKTSSFSNAPSVQPGFGASNAFGAFPQAPQAPQVQAPNSFGGQAPQPQGFPPQQQQQHFQQQPHSFQQQQLHFQQQQQQVYQQQQGQFGQFGFPGQSGGSSQQPQQQWIHPIGGAPHSNFASQQGHAQQAAPSAQPKPSAAPKADVAALNDPFASLSLGNFGLSGGAPSSASNSSSRGNSFAKPAGSLASSATSSFNSGAPSPFGGANMNSSMSGGPLPSSGGTRGNSFETPMAHFAAPPTPSPIASFSLPTMAAQSPTYPATSPSPMGSFAFPGGQSMPQKQSSFGDANAFGAFGAAAPAPPAASSNPFDMF